MHYKLMLLGNGSFVLQSDALGVSGSGLQCGGQVENPLPKCMSNPGAFQPGTFFFMMSLIL